MLVLSRKKQERIKIGDNVWITVCSINGDRVSLGFDAPLSVPVLREEVVLQIDARERAEREPPRAA